MKRWQQRHNYQVIEITLPEQKQNCDSDLSEVNSFAERLTNNNSKDNGDRRKVHQIFCFCYDFSLTNNGKLRSGSNYSGSDGESGLSGLIKQTIWPTVLSLKPIHDYADGGAWSDLHVVSP